MFQPPVRCGRRSEEAVVYLLTATMITTIADGGVLAAAALGKILADLCYSLVQACCKSVAITLVTAVLLKAFDTGSVKSAALSKMCQY